MTGNNLATTGLSFTFNYTWGHTIDNISSTFSESFNNFNLGLLDPFDPQLDKGNADFDLRHRVSISGVWDIPFARGTSGIAKHILDGWTIAPIFTAHKGFPFTVFDCTNAFFQVCPRMFATGRIPQRGSDKPRPDPNTPGVFSYLDLTGRFDSSYVHPIAGTAEFGPYPASMTGRNLFRGPGVWNLDVGLYKTTRITERFSIQYRAEFFNAFNHSNLYVIGSEADVSATSTIRVARGSQEGALPERRNIQMALKLIF